MVEDAPTSGKFYVRLERGDSHVMWGNYRTRSPARSSCARPRALWRQRALRSEEITSFGEPARRSLPMPRCLIRLPQRDEFLGTGGSAYFLRRQDITRRLGNPHHRGPRRRHRSCRQPPHPAITATTTAIDYLQGVVILSRRLSWRTGTNGPVRDGAFGGNIDLSRRPV